ncbi:MAG: ATP-binding protein, partial [Arcobacteraceae bacterium]
IQTVHMIENITISGQFKEKNYLSIASRNDEPMLNDILEKALNSLDESTKNTFINKWSSIRYETNADYTLVLQMLFLGLVILSIFMYWNLLLKEEIKKKEIAQKLLQDNEEKFRTLFDIAPVLLDAFDKDGNLTMWNKECEKVFGWTKDEINKCDNPMGLFYPHLKPQKEIKKLMVGKEQNTYYEWCPHTKDGRVLTILWANINLPNDEVIHIGYDITEERKNKRAIEEKTEQLRIAKKELEELNNSLEKRIENEVKENTKHQALIMHQSKLVQMGEMIENIAHQWRQPLAQINSSVLLIDAILVKKQCENEMVEDKLLEIESLTSYMSKTIDDFKNFFDPDKKKTLFSIKYAIEKAYDIVKGSLQSHHIQVAMAVDETLNSYSYLEELQQVLLTLLNNAVDALVLMNITKGEIKISVYTEKNSIIVEVQDNAKGIDEQYIDKVFEPYFTTKHKSQGTGLGLYMAKMIVENALEGNLCVKNRGDGACFTLTFPIKKGVE